GRSRGSGWTCGGSRRDKCYAGSRRAHEATQGEHAPLAEQEVAEQSKEHHHIDAETDSEQRTAPTPFGGVTIRSERTRVALTRQAPGWRLAKGQRVSGRTRVIAAPRWPGGSVPPHGSFTPSLPWLHGLHDSHVGSAGANPVPLWAAWAQRRAHTRPWPLAAHGHAEPPNTRYFPSSCRRANWE